MTAKLSNENVFARHHYLGVAVAKQVFLQADGRLAFSFRPLRMSQAQELGLSPLLLYALRAAGAELDWLILSRIESPLSLTDVLLQAWNGGKGFRGPPDAVLVNRHVMSACPELDAALREVGVQLQCVQNSKSHAAALRVAHSLVERAHNLSKNLEWTDSAALESFPRSMERYHEHQAKPQFTSDRAHREPLERWAAFAPRDIPSALKTSPFQRGPWALSWESSVSPHGLFHLHETRVGTYIREGVGDPQTPTGDDEIEGPFDDDEDDSSMIESASEADYVDDVRCAAKLLLACWPNPLSAIAEALGISTKQINWFLTGRGADDFPVEQLARLLHIGLDEMKHCEPRGAYTLIASEQCKAARELWDSLSHGGDISYAFEMLPERGSADPSFRYVLFACCAEEYSPSAFMVPRGSMIADRFEKEFMNFQGAREIDPDAYRYLVQTCARASLDPRRNCREMFAFARRQSTLIERFIQEGWLS